MLYAFKKLFLEQRVLGFTVMSFNPGAQGILHDFWVNDLTYHVLPLNI